MVACVWPIHMNSRRRFRYAGGLEKFPKSYSTTNKAEEVKARSPTTRSECSWTAKYKSYDIRAMRPPTETLSTAK